MMELAELLQPIEVAFQDLVRWVDPKMGPGWWHRLDVATLPPKDVVDRADKAELAEWRGKPATRCGLPVLVVFTKPTEVKPRIGPRGDPVCPRCQE